MNRNTYRVVLGALALSFVAAAGRASDLTGLKSIGSIVVTAANDTVAEADLREIVEQRLERAGLVVDGAPGSELLVNVAAERNRSENGVCAFGTFRVSLSLREAVTLERVPGRRVVAVTWTASGRITRFSIKEPPQMIKDTLETQMSSFLRAVASAAQEKRDETR